MSIMIIKLEHIDTGSFQITSQKYDKNEGLSFLCYNWSPRECSATFLLRHSRFVNENIAFLHLCVLYSRTSSRRFNWSHFFSLYFSHLRWNDKIRVISKNSIDCWNCQSVISYVKRLHQFYIFFFHSIYVKHQSLDSMLISSARFDL